MGQFIKAWRYGMFACLAALPAMASTTLEPGGVRTISQNLDINIVFVGFQAGTGPQQVQESVLRAQLPAVSQPIVRTPALYGLPNQYLGLNFHYNFHTYYANSTFENAFFGYLSSIATPDLLNGAQIAYNRQASRALTVTSNHTIVAVDVEKWLAANTQPMLGVDTRKYTVFFINWFGRADFKFHLYRKVDEPDLDTGFNFGMQAAWALMASGGTPPDDPQSGLGSLHRIWFCDLSAGPEAWQRGFNLNRADIDGDGRTDYRIPPVWEYGNLNPAHYRPFNTLSPDLGKLVRYVAVDLLFTTSPLYNPVISAPQLPSSINVNINLYQGEPGFDIRTQVKPDTVISKLAALRSSNTFTASLRDLSLVARASEIFNCFVGTFTGGASCFGNRLGTPFADLFLYYQDHLTQFLTGGADYEIPIFGWNRENPSTTLGFADDNWRDGTQSFVFLFVDKPTREAGFGFTETSIHEAGHHLGLSHPHDGYDYETNHDFSQGDFHFAWLGDESNTIMGYMFTGLDFSQFDRDNMNRWLTVGYINEANAILGTIQKSPRAGEAAARIASADTDASSALASYAAMDYGAAHAMANSAYRKIIAAAAQINVKVEPQSYQADYKSHGISSKFVDSVPYDRFGSGWQ
jgi:hypothetical protein